MTNQKGDIRDHDLFYEDPKKSDHTKYILGLTRTRRTKPSNSSEPRKGWSGRIGLRWKRFSSKDSGKD